MTLDEYKAEAIKRFGEDIMQWKFKCPICGNVASAQDYKEAGAPGGAVGFSCIGRWKDGSRSAFSTETGQPCDYAGGGLIRMNPISIDGEEIGLFELAEAGQG